MEVDAAHSARHLVETDVVEPLKAGAGDGAYAMVGHEEVFLPSHKDVFALGEVAICKVRSFRLLGERSPRREPGPVVHVSFLCGTPRLVTSLERMLGANDFSFEKCRQGRMILRKTCDIKIIRASPRLKVRPAAIQTLDAKVAAQVGLGHVHMFDFHIHIIDLAIRLLRADKLAA